MNIQMEGMHRARHGERVKGFYILKGKPQSQSSMCSALWKLSEPSTLGDVYKGFITQAWSVWKLISSPLPSPGGWKVDESSRFLIIMAWSFWWLVPDLKISRSPPPVTLLAQTHTYHPGNYKIFRSSGSGTRAKD